MKRISAALLFALMASPIQAETTCYGKGASQVCSTVTERADGSMTITSSDGMGNSYRVDSDVQTSANGDINIRSYDNTGNSYSVKSWSDSNGVYSRDSMGNVCSIMNDGTTIGC